MSWISHVYHLLPTRVAPALTRCACPQGCERKICPNECNGHGRCQSMGYAASLKDPGLGTVYSYKAPWDSEMMYGCNCDDGYFGPDCSLKNCPTGDDPFTGTKLNPATQQYNEKQQVLILNASGARPLQAAPSPLHQ
jgi:hypothetical protein